MGKGGREIVGDTIHPVLEDLNQAVPEVASSDSLPTSIPCWELAGVGRFWQREY
jgi:hypothetical protein